MTNAEIIVERKKYGSSAMDYTMRVYQKLDEETIMIDGVKYQKVEEPKPPTLYEMFCKEQLEFVNREVICDIVERWLPDELEYEEDEMGYNQGWNDCLNEIKKNLR
jgi:hypothetical protein